MYSKKSETVKEKVVAGKGKELKTEAYPEFIEKLAELVEAGKITKAEATDLYNSVVRRKTCQRKV